MQIAARQSFLTGRAGPTPWQNPYVTNGLIAMWDGEWNVAGQGGVNNPNATDWPALLGGGTWGTGTNIIYNASGHFYNTNNVGNGNALRFVFDANANTTGTFEFFVVGTYASGNYRRLIALDSGEFIQVGLSEIRIHYPGSSRYASASLNTPHSFVAANGKLYLDGALSTSVTPAATAIPHLLCPDNSANNVSGHIYAIRYYSRELSAAEVAANYAIDAARFGL